jgi:hypothetical protein
MTGLFPRLAAAAAALVLSQVAWAGDKTRPLGVVELFTSQGCSSCPEADQVFAELVKRGNLVALAYHVDYWDYLGWRDTLASPDNTQRQYDYAKSFASHSVYTPQVVINGRAHMRGSDRTEIEQTLSSLAAAGEGLSVDITVKRAEDSIIIDAGEGTGDEQAQLIVVTYDPALPVAIDRGENVGRTITYWNSVNRVQTVGMWHGAAARFELPAGELARKGTGGAAILLQAKGSGGMPGPILGAAIIENAGR